MLLTGVIISTDCFSQQDPRASFFWNQYMHTNPAMTGAIYKHHANAQWRNQWTKVNGAPTTLWLNYAMKLDSINSGVGVSYEYDVIGLNKQHTALVSYAYHIPIKKMFLSLGVSVGTLTMLFDKTGIIFNDPNDPGIPKSSQTYFRGDLGIALHGEKWNAGLSCTKLNGYFTRNSGTYDIAPHYWFFGDYTFQLGQNWKLTPRAQVSTDMLKVHSIVALVASWKNLWFGSTAAFPGNGFELGPMIGYDIAGKFRLGYCYEFGVNTHFSNAINNNRTHEIILSYQLK
ncbi:MAG: putative rane protein [Fluviicola sp.]|nr:putative rane protein [Fluviicola sp.]